MPAPARHQLAILLLTADVEALVAGLLADGWLAADPAGRLGPGPRPLVPGGFLQARACVFPEERFVGSGQGGFRVYCPVDSRNVTGAFTRALSAWRAAPSTATRAMSCVCGGSHDLAGLDFRPHCGFARQWLELADVGRAELHPGVLPAGVEVVLRRG